MAWQWYGVKCLHEFSLGGASAPMRRLGASTKYRLIEERVVLVRARNFDEAIRKAEKCAKAYSRGLSRRRNGFGQAVRNRYLGLCDAYLMDCLPVSGAEVFSGTRLVSRAVGSKAVARMFLGPKSSQWEQEWRVRFEPWLTWRDPPWRPKAELRRG